MTLKKIVLAIGLSCVSFSIYAADQVIKEETTPPAPEGALTVDQITPVYNQPQQKTPAINPNATTPPGASVAPPPQQPMNPPAAPQQNMPQGTMPQNTMPDQPQMMPSAPQNGTPPQQQPMMQQPQTAPGPNN